MNNFFIIYRSRCLVVHPINPPIYIPLVEIVPSPWTSDGIVSQTVEIMRSIRQVSFSVICLSDAFLSFNFYLIFKFMRKKFGDEDGMLWL